MPRHHIILHSAFVCGELVVAICPKCIIYGVTLILWNDLAGQYVAGISPPRIVSSSPTGEPDDVAVAFPDVFTASAVTRSMMQSKLSSKSDSPTRRNSPQYDLCDTFL